jgi:hypothetical protein
MGCGTASAHSSVLFVNGQAIAASKKAFRNPYF